MKNKKMSVTILFAVFIAMMTAAVMVSGATTPITLSQVAAHNTASDCWSALNGGVYNLTSYIPSHPGGTAIMPICGIDGTQLLAAKHGLGILSLVSDLQIGVLAAPNTTGNQTNKSTPPPVNNQTETANENEMENEAEQHNETNERDNGQNNVSEAEQQTNNQHAADNQNGNEQENHNVLDNSGQNNNVHNSEGGNHNQGLEHSDGHEENQGDSDD